MARPTPVDTDEVRKLVAGGAQLVEVLPAADYNREHLPGAVSLPLADLDEHAASRLDRGRTVVVYCYDHECDLSARGAALLAALGFDDVRDYAASKTAWLGAGLPAEGSVAESERAGAIADREVPTCRFTDDVGAVTDVLRGHVHDICVVVDEERIVLGTVDRRVTSLAADTPVRHAMAPAPNSVRPSILRRELASSMDRNGESHVLVTTSAGELIGVVTREALRHGDG